jgi:hypothetical protein
VFTLGISSTAAAQDPAPVAPSKNVRGLVPNSFFAGLTPHSHADITSPRRRDGHGASPFARPTPSPIDSLTTWSDSFAADGFDANGNPQSIWTYTMIGNAPETNRPFAIRAPVIPVTVELLDPDGRVVQLPNGNLLRDVVGPSIVDATVHSPIFEPFNYTSGIGQFTDQLQRASFWNRFVHFGMDDDDHGWHTTLVPAVQRTRVMRLPSGSWLAALNADGTCCSFVEVDADVFTNLLFPPAGPLTNQTVIGDAELSGDMTTRDLTTFLFHNVALFTGGDPINGCCIAGFHSVDVEPGDRRNGNRERRYVLDFASWNDPGVYFFGFSDIAALSHELAEAVNNPFGDNAVPWWLSQDPLFGFAQCQPVLETGDVIEVLNSGSPIFTIAHHGRTYHLQNEAMFPWFAEQSPSSAHLGAYSFPDETSLTALSPHPLGPGCVGGPPAVSPTARR